MNEKFKKFENWLIGDQGTVLNKTGERKLGSFRKSTGYIYLNTKKYGNVGVHRLVLMAWVGRRKNLVVDHLNGIKTDNRLCNLEYVTQTENCLRHHLSGRANYSKPPGAYAGAKNAMSRPVIVDGYRFEYGRQAADKLGISPQALFYRIKSENFPNYQYEGVKL